MKLYYSTGACSLSPHIALREAGLDFELKKVDLRSKKVEDGSDYLAVNPKGYVPALVLDDGRVLTEGPALVQFIADQVPAQHLAPAPGSFERYRLQEWLTFINSEVHKSFGAMFNPKLTDELKAMYIQNIKNRLAWVDSQLAGQDFLLGSDLSVADIYLFVVVNWGGLFKLDFSHLSNLQGMMARIGARPAVQAALKAEGLA